MENVSAYLRYQESDLSEGEFISAVAEAADCYLLLDLNNLYVKKIEVEKMYFFNGDDYEMAYDWGQLKAKLYDNYTMTALGITISLQVAVHLFNYLLQNIPKHRINKY